jgi:exosortase C (VPDSG-CTERM-specific)
LKGLVLFSIILAAGFLRPLYDLVHFAWHSDLYSHILLIPFISAYLIRLRKPTLRPDAVRVRSSPDASTSKPQTASSLQIPAELLAGSGKACSRPHKYAQWFLALLSLLAGLTSLASYWRTAGAGWKGPLDDHLALMMLAFLAFLLTGALLFLEGRLLRQIVFPAVLLLFMVPVPSVVLRAIEGFLQHRSADVADLLFTVAGTPVLREETFFQLPGMPLEVAPECSGVHSTLVLFITSLIAGYLFLRTPWKRAVLTLSVIPLALLRNGFRIFTIGELCVHLDPDMIHSPIHTHGGPIFFALSLIPFFLVLALLRKGESSSLLQE